MAELFIIDETWTEHTWVSTGGTRAKKYLQGPDSKFYYFKNSQLKEGKDYTFEFWNEIIAYELGTMLGFDMLRYDIALDGPMVGCICESMINLEYEELIEGVKYLQAYSPNYDPNVKEHQKWYTFDLIERSLESAGLIHFIDEIIKVIVFDSLIGNGDRHQENWALINKQRLLTEIIEELENDKKVKIPKALKKLQQLLKIAVDGYKSSGKKMPKSLYQIDLRFSPIYDSGSSLGRELLSEKIQSLLNVPTQLSSYINRGTSEIHWENKKISHFDLIRNLLSSKHQYVTNEIITKTVENFDAALFMEIVQRIDYNIPQTHLSYKIPADRKELIIKIITLRIEVLRQLI